MGGFVIDILVEFVARAILNSFRNFRSRSWPVVAGKVKTSKFIRAGYGCDLGEVRYSYRVGDHQYTGTYKEPFLIRGSGQGFIQSVTEHSQVPVSYDPANPAKSWLREIPAL